MARISDMLPSLTISKKFDAGVMCRLAIETTSRRLLRIRKFLTSPACREQVLELVEVARPWVATGRASRAACCA